MAQSKVLVLRLLRGSNQPNQTEPDRTVEVVDSDSVEQQEDLSPPLKVLGPDVELTSEPDMITFDDDKDGQRAKMPCPESLTAYCRSLLSAGKFEFRCPHMDPKYCGRLWEYYTIQQCAVLTKEERKEFETKIALNFLNKSGMQECPNCQSYCARKSKKDIRVICPICSRKKGRGVYEFCWFCLRVWKTSGQKECGILNCSGEDPRKKILRECPEKDVIGVKCPAVRACPKCGMMIEHKEACKHMDCPCGQQFCFICLKMATGKNTYQCGSYNTKCEKAPIQTELP